MSAALEIRGLTVDIGGSRVVDSLDLRVGRGERVGLIGESGSGKSLSLLSLIGLAPSEATVSGSVVLGGGELGGTELHGTELVGLPERRLARLRGSRIGMVFQDPLTALNPLHTLGRQIAEPLRLHEGLAKKEALVRAAALAAEVGLPEGLVDSYPHQVSGGQRQRVGIAIALACRPEVLLADEPTTALDVTTQAEVLALFRRLVDDLGTSLVFVTHDLAVLAQITTDAVVLSHGHAVERGSVAELLHTPQHAVTQGLVAAARATTWSAS